LIQAVIFTKDSLIPKYAAEFTVIVVGVVVALGFDEWRQSVSDSAEELRYFHRLAQDLSGDVDSWESLLADLNLKDQALNRLETWRSDATSSQAQEARMVVNDIATASVYAGSIPPPRNSTYQDLLATGNLHLIQDEVFRADLLDYHFQIQNGLDRINSRVTGYDEFAYRLVPREPLETADNIARSDLTASELTSIMERVTQGDLEPYLIAEQNRSKFLRSHVGRFLENAKLLLDRINSRIANSSAG
jgi:hypothetical protein